MRHVCLYSATGADGPLHNNDHCLRLDLAYIASYPRACKSSLCLVHLNPPCGILLCVNVTTSRAPDYTRVMSRPCFAQDLQEQVPQTDQLHPYDFVQACHTTPYTFTVDVAVNCPFECSESEWPPKTIIAKSKAAVLARHIFRIE